MADAYTKLLLHMNADFSDSSPDNRSPTLVNAPTIDTGTKYFGAGSGKFVKTSSQAVTYPDSTDWTLGQTFTIDTWFYATDLPANNTSRMLAGTVSNDGNYGWFLAQQQVSGVHQMTFLAYYAALSFTFTVTGTVSATTWHHIAIVDNATAWNMYIDGTSVGNASNAVAVNNSSQPLAIGARRYLGAYDNHWNGFIDEFRISKGIARWTGNFTPPTAEYDAVTGGFMTTNSKFW
jgi:hypothetical protein